jgi:hypothetical protein
MRRLIPIALLLLPLLCAPASADEIEAGETTVCETQKQVERLAAVFTGDAELAAQTVNNEERDPTACGTVELAYLRGARVATIRTKRATFEIVEILVVGLLGEDGVEATKPAIYFALIEIDEVAV